jgi:hypothetical protein
MALTKSEVESLVYKRGSTNNERTHITVTSADKLVIKNTMEQILSLILQKHS